MSRRTNRILLVVVLVAFINLPVLHSAWTRWQVDRNGTDTVADVLPDSRVLGEEADPSYWVLFRFSEDIDPDQVEWSAQVDRDTFEEASAEGSIEVRVLEDQPAAHVVEGEVRNRLGLVITLAADAILLAILLLVWRARPTRPVPIRIAAIGDVERCPPGGALEQIEGDLYLVRGEVTGIDGDEIVLDAGERDVLVILDGHHNPVGYQQPAEVRGRIVP